MPPQPAGGLQALSAVTPEQGSENPNLTGNFWQVTAEGFALYSRRAEFFLVRSLWTGKHLSSPSLSSPPQSHVPLEQGTRQIVEDEQSRNGPCCFIVTNPLTVHVWGRISTGKASAGETLQQSILTLDGEKQHGSGTPTHTT